MVLNQRSAFSGPDGGVVETPTLFTLVHPKPEGDVESGLKTYPLVPAARAINVEPAPTIRSPLVYEENPVPP